MWLSSLTESNGVVEDMQDGFENWIGRHVIRKDVVSQRLIDQFRSTLLPHVLDVECPPGLHWCLAVASPEPGKLGQDGAEAKGLFLPPVPLPRRMWAGGKVEILGPFTLGANVSRTSWVSEVKWREGSAGPLCIVSVTHELSSSGQLLLRERHDILFRDGAMAAPPPPKPLPQHSLAWMLEATPVLLFRYSALTFNGHRIHYDYPYATQVEGYGGLLVHGPLQATLLMNQLARAMARMPKVFTYRCVSPLTAGQAIHVLGSRNSSGAHGIVASSQGTVTLEGEAE